VQIGCEYINKETTATGTRRIIPAKPANCNKAPLKPYKPRYLNFFQLTFCPIAKGDSIKVANPKVKKEIS